MRPLHHLLLVASLVSMQACTPLVCRWTLGGADLAGGVLPSTRQSNIFSDFLWTTPPIASRKLEFEGGLAKCSFAGEQVVFRADAEGTVSLLRGQTTQTAQLQRSERNLYFDRQRLGTRLVFRQRMVTRTRMESRSEPVTRTRYVGRSVMVQKTRSVPHYDSSARATRYRTESYTTTEWKSVPETYTEYERHTRWVPYTEWTTVSESVLDIPAYDYYELTWDEQTRILVYRVARPEGGVDYFLQNPTYLAGHGSQRAVASGAVSILAVDANSNGVYFEEDDRILFNSWNPYRQDSRYSEVRGMLDNYWYRMGDLARHHLLWVSQSADGGMAFESPNSRFLGVTARGDIHIRGLEPRTSSVFLNGRRYKTRKDGTLQAKIEHGVYQLRIATTGAADFNELFTVDETRPRYELEYQKPEPAGALNIANISLISWKVVVTNAAGLVSIDENATRVSLPEGNYEVAIFSGGYVLSKPISVSGTSSVTLDYDAEVKALESARPPG